MVLCRVERAVSIRFSYKQKSKIAVITVKRAKEQVKPRVKRAKEKLSVLCLFLTIVRLS